MKFRSEKDLEEYVLENGCFDHRENYRIFHDTFIPAYKTFLRISSYFDFHSRKVLDIGCGYGSFLIHFNNKSLGIEIQDKLIQFVDSMDLRYTKKMNIEEGFDIGEKFDVIFCRQVLDHMVAPHKVLVESHGLLEDDGYLIACIDNIDYILDNKVASEHLYGFNLKSLKILVQRSGFDVLKIFTTTSNKPLIFEMMINSSVFLVKKTRDIYVIAKKNPQYRYPTKRRSEFTPSWLSKELVGE